MDLTTGLLIAGGVAVGAAVVAARSNSSTSNDGKGTEEERQLAIRETPTEQRNCMNCAYLDQAGNYKCTLDNNFLDTEKIEEIAKQNCQTSNWQPRKHHGSYMKYIFSPEEWYKEY